jgi:hypothetical protein
MMADPDATWPKREMVELYLQSLPRRSYWILMFAALVKALALQSFGNVFYVPDFPDVVERQFQRGHRGARQSPLLLAGSVLTLLRRVYRARLRRFRSPPQTARRSLEAAKIEGERLRPQPLHLTAVGLAIC